MKKRAIFPWITALFLAFPAACAIITVNIYFPEKEVKEAYKSLDEMLLHQPPASGPPAAAEPRPGNGPGEGEPHSMMPYRLLRFTFAGEAFAAENLAESLAVELSSMTDVLKAYEEMNARLQTINTLRDIGAVGENGQGLLNVRDPAKLGDKQALIKAENENRKTVITGMARAILRINKQPETKETLNQVLPKAAATYAETRREAAKAGWWIQLANGRWVQK